ILNFSFIALCLVYFFVLIVTTNNARVVSWDVLTLILRYAFCSTILIVAGFVFLISGTASAFITSRIIKMSQGKKLGKGVYIVSVIIKIITALALIVAAGLVAIFGFYLPLIAPGDLLFVGDLLFALVLARTAVYQIFLIIQEGKSRKELFSV
ncbi:MAG: hypothetical protein IJY26_00065, partial [Clostridia bacterium]|nr:hypothetical protein [Clostridia bacterium]